MAFYNNKYENNSDVSVDQLKTMIIDSFKTLEQSVEDLENEQKSIKDQLIQISNILSNLEKETTKTSLKYNTLESQSALIKQLSSKIESIKAETTELTLALSAQVSELVERVSNLIQ
jgi:chromosome segregation ATPase